VYGGGGDGTRRVLVDRLWPRGLAKDAAGVDAWLPQAAPSRELRVWYGHDPARYAEFARRYAAELDAPTPAGAAALAELARLAARYPVTLLTATREQAGSHLPVLARWLAAAVGSTVDGPVDSTVDSMGDRGG